MSVSYLQDEKPWGNDDPLFPATQMTLGTYRKNNLYTAWHQTGT